VRKERDRRRRSLAPAKGRATFPTPGGERDGSTKAGHAPIPTSLSVKKEKEEHGESKAQRGCHGYLARGGTERPRKQGGRIAVAPPGGVGVEFKSRIGCIRRQIMRVCCVWILALYEHGTDPALAAAAVTHLRRGERKKSRPPRLLQAAFLPCIACVYSVQYRGAGPGLEVCGH